MKILLPIMALLSCNSYDFKYCIDRRYSDPTKVPVSRSYCHEYKTDRELYIHFIDEIHDLTDDCE